MAGRESDVCEMGDRAGVVKYHGPAVSDGVDRAESTAYLLLSRDAPPKIPPTRPADLPIEDADTAAEREAEAEAENAVENDDDPDPLAPPSLPRDPVRDPVCDEDEPPKRAAKARPRVVSGLRTSATLWAFPASPRAPRVPDAAIESDAVRGGSHSGAPIPTTGLEGRRGGVAGRPVPALTKARAVRELRADACSFFPADTSPAPVCENGGCSAAGVHSEGRSVPHSVRESE